MMLDFTDGGVCGTGGVTSPISRGVQVAGDNVNSDDSVEISVDSRESLESTGDVFLVLGG